MTKSKKRAFWRSAAHRLRVTRLALGISEKEAAAAYGVCLATYRKYEAGGYQRTCETVVNFAQKYKVSLNWLVAGDAAEIGPHLAEEAPGRIAILPVVGKEHREKLARCAALHPLSV